MRPHCASEKASATDRDCGYLLSQHISVTSLGHVKFREVDFARQKIDLTVNVEAVHCETSAPVLCNALLKA